MQKYEGLTLTVKEKCYLVLEKLGGSATEKELVEEYIKTFPDYSKNYKETKTPPEQKIRGTIQSSLKQNSSHDFIKVDNSTSPYKYFITQ